MLRMRFRKLADGTARYGVSGWYRWVYGLFCLLIGTGFFTVLRDGTFSGAALIPVILFLISLLGLGYRERWIFDPQQGRISYGIGIFFLFRRASFPVESVRRIEITHFVRGRSPLDTEARPRGRNKAMVVCSLRMQDDSTRDIEILAEHTSAGRTETAAQAIAALMDLPYHADREPDVARTVSVRDL